MTSRYNSLGHMRSLHTASRFMASRRVGSRNKASRNAGYGHKASRHMAFRYMGSRHAKPFRATPQRARRGPVSPHGMSQDCARPYGFLPHSISPHCIQPSPHCISSNRISPHRTSPRPDHPARLSLDIRATPLDSLLTPDVSPRRLPRDSRSSPDVTSGWRAPGPRHARPGLRRRPPACFGMLGEFRKSRRSNFLILPDVEFWAFLESLAPKNPEKDQQKLGLPG